MKTNPLTFEELLEQGGYETLYSHRRHTHLREPNPCPADDDLDEYDRWDEVAGPYLYEWAEYNGRDNDDR